MFEELQRTLQRIGATQTVSVPLSADGDGYLDRECPVEVCQFDFKVLEEDWNKKVRPEEVFCPFCRHTAPNNHWYTQEQLQGAREYVVAQLKEEINSAIKGDAQRWNRQQPRNAFISMTMSVDSKPQQVLLPVAAAAPMQLKVSCPECACRYAAVGVAFFCPACGHNAADLMFEQSIGGIRSTLDAIPSVRAAISDRDAAETTVRVIIENGLQNGVTAFQRYAEALYAARYPASPAPRRNALQNLAEGSALWQAASGKQYSDYLTAAELNPLTRYFQQRHLLAHRQGLVDADYIARSGDTSYREGQRLVIRETAVRECLTLIEKLARGMAA